jgi:hypothetical protein
MLFECDRRSAEIEIENGEKEEEYILTFDPWSGWYSTSTRWAVGQMLSLDCHRLG